MGRAKPEIPVLRDGLARHPAFLAWQDVAATQTRPTSIEVLKPEKRKSEVFRLNGVGPRGRPVVAKRRPVGDIDIELRLYTELLPELRIASLELYGFTSDEAGFGWLFVEDAGEEWYSPDIAEHRVLAVAWLAKLHTQSATTRPWLPRTGTEYFMGQLRAARDGILDSVTHHSLSPSDVAVLQLLDSHLGCVEQHWDVVVRALEGVPNALVHGDFVPKNVRVRHGALTTELVAFDWETAGWAPPAADLALLRGQPERHAYHDQVVQFWPTMTRADIDRLYQFGTVLRYIHAVRWETRSFKHAWIERAVRNMRSYEARLADLCNPLGWTTT